jgi:heat shock protein HslJ
MNTRNFFTGRAVGFIVVLVILGIIAAFYSFNNFIYNQEQSGTVADYKDAEYTIEGMQVKLTKGFAETEAAPGSASKITTKYFGNELRTDLNADGREDVVFLLTQQTGGTGTNYYVVAALNTENGYVGSEGYLLGDRIAPQTTEKGSGNIIIVNYADRAAGQPFTDAPSVGKSVRLILDVPSMQFGIVASNFEGEANPSTMTLGMKPWTWISAADGEGNTLMPKTPGAFVLTFRAGGEFGIKTDCNSGGGKYVAGSSTITFSNVISTQMYCEGSQEALFAKMLQNVPELMVGYKFTSKGELVFSSLNGKGTATFK